MLPGKRDLYHCRKARRSDTSPPALSLSREPDPLPDRFAEKDERSGLVKGLARETNPSLLLLPLFLTSSNCLISLEWSTYYFSASHRCMTQMGGEGTELL